MRTERWRKKGGGRNLRACALTRKKKDKSEGQNKDDKQKQQRASEVRSQVHAESLEHPQIDV